MATETPAPIRLLVAADTDLYREVRLEGLKQNPTSFGSTFAFENDQPRSWFEAMILQSDIFGAFAAGDLLGVAAYRRFDGPKHLHKGMLWGMYVRAVARNFGLGKRLVEAVVEHASREVEQLNLTVASENPAARRLYEKLGFVEYGRETRALKQDGRYTDDILMVRFLAVV